MVLAAGALCWLMGFALDRQVAEMISAVNSSATTAESASRNVAWIQNTYWLLHTSCELAERRWWWAACSP